MLAPHACLGKMFDRALVSLLRDLERSKFAATDAPRGTSTLDNIELRCRAHNMYEASLFSGDVADPLVREVTSYYGSRL